LDPKVEEIIKNSYLSHARDVSYMMQAKAYLTDDHSVLGGKFLRMYLDGELDADVVEDAGEEIAASSTFLELQKGTNERIQSRIDKTLRRLPTEKELADIARQYLQKIKKKKGIAFRGPLNPVVGGLREIDVGPAARFVKRVDAPSGSMVEYEFDVLLSDTYDFGNKRTGEYDAYRKRLAKLLQENNFWEFDKSYWGEVLPVDSWHKTKIRSNAALFASYMYALEMRGWTPGPLPWSVTTVMRGVIHKIKK
jgi:hypothetical protein